MYFEGWGKVVISEDSSYSSKIQVNQWEVNIIGKSWCYGIAFYFSSLTIARN